MDNIFSEVRIKKLPKMKVAKHEVNSQTPEDDVTEYMENWKNESGIMDLKDYTPQSFGWDVAVKAEIQKNNPNFRGYALCVTLPENFTPKCDGVEITYIEAGEYAVMQITEPFVNPFERIPGGWQKLSDYLQIDDCRTIQADGRYWMEEVFVIDGVTFMNIYFPLTT